MVRAQGGDRQAYRALLEDVACRELMKFAVDGDASAARNGHEDLLAVDAVRRARCRRRDRGPPHAGLARATAG
jgi:hypothetical protein